MSDAPGPGPGSPAVEPRRPLRVRVIVELIGCEVPMTLREIADAVGTPNLPQIQSILGTLSRCPALYEDTRPCTGEDTYGIDRSSLAEWIGYLLTERRKHI